MFEKAVGDPDYARQRGITADVAKQFLDAHKADGSPRLPGRAVVKAAQSTPAPKHTVTYLSSRREG